MVYDTVNPKPHHALSFEHCGKTQLLRHLPDVAPPDPCPVCSGRTPILDYAREVLRDLIVDYDKGRITTGTMRDCLAALEKEMTDASRR